jgi:NADH:ubiquinone oxidoreductase subunit 5 (subunit L)/multisubunit Na+/H+ antiporter MnhA subunit
MFLMPAATDLIMMYIALELVSITSYIMAGFMKETDRGSEASWPNRRRDGAHNIPRRGHRWMHHP